MTNLQDYIQSTIVVPKGYQPCAFTGDRMILYEPVKVMTFEDGEKTISRMVYVYLTKQGIWKCRACNSNTCEHTQQAREMAKEYPHGVVQE